MDVERVMDIDSVIQIQIRIPDLYRIRLLANRDVDLESVLLSVLHSHTQSELDKDVV